MAMKAGWNLHLQKQSTSECQVLGEKQERLSLSLPPPSHLPNAEVVPWVTKVT